MIGAFIGAFIGFAKGGFFGLFLGGMVGSWIQGWILQNSPGQSSKTEQVQKAYFEALFTTIGKIAKVDGVITEDEILKSERIMQKMQLNSDQRKLAIQFFNRGKQADFDIRPCVDRFHQMSGNSYSVKQMFLEMLLDVAASRSLINQAEWNLLLEICQYLNFPHQLFVALVKMRGFNVDGSHTNTGGYQSRHGRKWTPPTQQKVNPYQVLGVSESSSKKDIRRAYKKLMSSHHPDKLIAKGLPPEMIEVAKTKTQEIQAAWESIKNSRGF